MTQRVINPGILEQYRKKDRILLPDGIHRFDSQHEFKVFLELKRMYGHYRIKKQVRTEIIPPGMCYPRGRKWKIDFAVRNFENPDIFNCFVEAKGLFIPEFGFCLAALPRKNKILKSLFDNGWENRIMLLQDLQKMEYLS